MRGVARVLRRDVRRLVTTPAALVVVIALLVLPSAYTWYNVAAFWDPYGSTGNLRVSVVNEDAGAESDVAGRLDVGDMIVDELRENDQLAWEFVDRETAMDELSAGESYAAFVIPEDFTSNLLAILDGGYVQPKLEYYVNEKAGPVSPKITDTGATALDEQVSEAFTSAVGDVVARAANGALADAGAFLTEARSRAVEALEEAEGSVAGSRATLGDAVRAAEGARAAAADARAVLDRARGAVEAASDALEAAASGAQDARSRLDEADAELGRADAALREQAGALAELADRLDEAATALEGTDAGEAVRAQAAAVRAAADGARRTASSLDGAASSASDGMAELSSALSSLSAAVSAQSALVDEAEVVLDGIDGVLGTATTAASRTDESLAGVEGDLSAVRDDLLALGASDALAGLADGEALNADAIASFAGSPTVVETVGLYPLDSYGSAMAPLFMSLTFWIGAFMLVVIMRQEVDAEGVGRLTAAERYLARFALFGILAAIQAVVCCVGVLAIGVRAADVAALFVASVAASLAYASVIFALSSVLRHIGKGLCVVAVFAQIPGATGLYPTEMTSAFFQAVHPLFPFTYGIGALREAIFGFYGTHFAAYVAALAAFLAASLAIGLVATPLMTNTSRLMARQVREGGLYNGEDVAAPARPYRLSQLFRALTEQERYRAELQARYDRFLRRYPRLLRAALVAGIVVPVGLAVVFALTPTEKVVLLTAWLVWLVAVLVFLVVVESHRSSFERQLEIGGMDAERLVGLGASGDEAGEGDAARGGEGGGAHA